MWDLENKKKIFGLEKNRGLPFFFLFILKLLNFLWQGFHVSYVVNAAEEGPLSNTVASWPNVRPRKSKKSERPDKSAAKNWGRVFPERAKKELNFETALNEEKCYYYKRVNFFPLAAEYFGQSRRIIAERVGNTVLEESQDGNFQIMINQLTQPMPAILHSLPF